MSTSRYEAYLKSMSHEEKETLSKYRDYKFRTTNNMNILVSYRDKLSTVSTNVISTAEKKKTNNILCKFIDIYEELVKLHPLYEILAESPDFFPAYEIFLFTQKKFLALMKEKNIPVNPTDKEIAFFIVGNKNIDEYIQLGNQFKKDLLNLLPLYHRQKELIHSSTEAMSVTYPLDGRLRKITEKVSRAIAKEKNRTLLVILNSIRELACDAVKNKAARIWNNDGKPAEFYLQMRNSILEAITAFESTIAPTRDQVKLFDRVCEVYKKLQDYALRKQAAEADTAKAETSSSLFTAEKSPASAATTQPTVTRSNTAASFFPLKPSSPTKDKKGKNAANQAPLYQHCPPNDDSIDTKAVGYSNSNLRR